MHPLGLATELYPLLLYAGIKAHRCIQETLGHNCKYEGVAPTSEINYCHITHICNHQTKSYCAPPPTFDFVPLHLSEGANRIYKIVQFVSRASLHSEHQYDDQN